MPTDTSVRPSGAAAGAAGAVAVVGAIDAAGDSRLTGQQKEYAVASALLTVGVALNALGPVGVVAGIIVDAVAGVLALYATFFGSKWHQSTQVRWLIQAYQHHVLGNSGVTSDNKVNEGYLTDCYNWFGAVLNGVFIYDKIRLHALWGSDTGTGRPLVPFPSVAQRAAKFLSFGDPQNVGVSIEDAEMAVVLADQLAGKGGGDYQGIPAGAWKNVPVATYWYIQITPELAATADIDSELAALDVSGSPEAIADGQNPLGISFGGLSESIWLGLICVLAGIYFLFFRRK